MRIYLDDERETPEGWHRCYWPSEVISLLQAGGVTEISLDHDLGDAEAAALEGRKEITGYAVIEWVEEKVFCEGLSPPALKVHSANPAARRKMELGISSIRNLSMTQP